MFSLFSILLLILVGGKSASAQPIGYFTFASDASIVLRENLDPVKAKVGRNFMVGGDSGYPFVSSEFRQVMQKADRYGSFKHVYLEGPGGPTGSGGIAGDECQRMIERARRVGIKIDRNDCSNKAKWIKTWNAGGWWDSTLAEIRYFHTNFGVVSIEIDNLYRAGVESSASVVAFIKRFQSAMIAANLPVALLLKNTTVDDLNAIKADMDSGRPGRVLKDYLSDFAISEEDFRSEWPAIKRASKRIGIVTLTSSDTYNYKAKGYWQ